MLLNRVLEAQKEWERETGRQAKYVYVSNVDMAEMADEASVMFAPVEPIKDRLRLGIIGIRNGADWFVDRALGKGEFRFSDCSQ